MKSQMILNLKWHEISNDMKSQMTWNLIWHKISNDMKYKMTWNLKRHEMSNDIKFQMSNYEEMGKFQEAPAIRPVLYALPYT